MISAGELAKKSGVSKRTIHYYDDIDLLKPTQRDEHGSRWYAEHEFEQLQKILFLKAIGHTLHDIKAIIAHDDRQFKEVLGEQLNVIQAKKRELDQMEKTTRAILHAIDIEEKVDWDILFSLMQMIQNKDLYQKKMKETYFPEVDEKTLQELPELGDDSSLIDEWIAMFKKAKEHMYEDPGSPQVQELAEQWMDKVNHMFHGDESLMAKAQDYLNDQIHTPFTYPMDQEVMTFMEKAINIMYERKEDRHD